MGRYSDPEWGLKSPSPPRKSGVRPRRAAAILFLPAHSARATPSNNCRIESCPASRRRLVRMKAGAIADLTIDHARPAGQHPDDGLRVRSAVHAACAVLVRRRRFSRARSWRCSWSCRFWRWSSRHSICAPVEIALVVLSISPVPPLLRDRPYHLVCTRQWPSPGCVAPRRAAWRRIVGRFVEPTFCDGADRPCPRCDVVLIPLAPGMASARCCRRRCASQRRSLVAKISGDRHSRDRERRGSGAR